MDLILEYFCFMAADSQKKSTTFFGPPLHRDQNSEQINIKNIKSVMFPFAIQPRTKFILRTFRVEESFGTKSKVVYHEELD